MTYRRTDFGNAEQEQALQKASTMLYGVQRGVLDTQAHLAAGHLEDGFRSATATQKRLDVADRFVRRTAGLPAPVIEGLNVARVQVTRMWSRFDSSATGRAALRKGFAGIGDDIMGGVDSLKIGAGGLIDTGRGVVSDVKGAVDDWKGLYQEGKAVVDAVTGGDSQIPCGTQYSMPTCRVVASPLGSMQYMNDLAYGIPVCGAGKTPEMVPLVACQDDGVSIRTKIAEAQSRQGIQRPSSTQGTPLTQAQIDQANYSIQQENRLGVGLARAKNLQGGGGQSSQGRTPSVLSQVPTGVWIGAAFLAAKTLLAK